MPRARAVLLVHLNPSRLHFRTAVSYFCMKGAKRSGCYMVYDSLEMKSIVCLFSAALVLTRQSNAGCVMLFIAGWTLIGVDAALGRLITQDVDSQKITP